MNLFKRLGIAIGAIAFCLSLFVIAGQAQDGRWRWRNYDRSEKSWNKARKYRRPDRRIYSRYRPRYIGYNRFNRYPGYGGRITPREARRLARQRARIYNARNRYYRDGYLSPRERRQLRKQIIRYRRNVIRARLDR
jgi:hypothetical protein